MMQRASRSWSPLREVAHALERESTESSLILVHSIPSGVLGIARYYQGEAPLAAWVEQLGGRRVPESFLALARGKEQVVLVRAHEVGAPCPLEEWLRAEATLSFEGRRESILLRNVRPKGAPSF
jgi:hypothetical protein